MSPDPENLYDNNIGYFAGYDGSYFPVGSLLASQIGSGIQASSQLTGRNASSNNGGSSGSVSTNMIRVVKKGTGTGILQTGSGFTCGVNCPELFIRYQEALFDLEIQPEEDSICSGIEYQGSHYSIADIIQEDIAVDAGETVYVVFDKQ